MGYIKPADFIAESNLIEGIVRDPTAAEIEMFNHFMQLKTVTVRDLQEFVSIYEPGARLRDYQACPGVTVGNYTPPASGPDIRDDLNGILNGIHPNGDWGNAYWTHVCYERLHPFTDGNGRSGRMLWKWMMQDSHTKGFLHTFYYQSLQFVGRPQV